MSEFTTVYLFTELGDFQIRATIWTIIIWSIPIVWFLFFLFSNIHVPQQLSWIKGKVYIKNASLPTLNLLLALITILLVWLILMVIFVQLTTHPELGTPTTFGSQKYSELKKIYNSHQYFVTEGPVHVLHAENRYFNIVTIGNVEFKIIFLHRDTFGYYKTIHQGGALTEGTYARVFYIDNDWPDSSEYGRYTILRVDIKNK